MARQALMDGSSSSTRTRGWRGPVEAFDDLGADWGVTVSDVPPLTDVLEWRLAVVLSVDAKAAKIGLSRSASPAPAPSARRRETGTIPLDQMKWAKWADRRPARARRSRSLDDVLNVGDVVYVEPADGDPATIPLRQVPEGRGRASSPWTRTPAACSPWSAASPSPKASSTARRRRMRQPGSSFKPFVYSAALDNGYTPSSVVMDAPIEIDQGGGSASGGRRTTATNITARRRCAIGIEQSRNVMTVRLAKDMGMPLVAEYARRFGIYDNLLPVLSMALGAGETTVMRMVAGYSMIANGGRQIKPTLIDRIQDRYGKTIFRHDERICEGCDADDWHNQAEPPIIDNREQVLDPMTAYQITSMMEGVVQRGTGYGRQGDRQADRRQDRHDQRLQGRLVRRLTRRTSSSASMSATTSRARSAVARPAAGWRRRSSPSSCRWRWPASRRCRSACPRA